MTYQSSYKRRLEEELLVSAELELALECAVAKSRRQKKAYRGLQRAFNELSMKLRLCQSHQGNWQRRAYEVGTRGYGPGLQGKEVKRRPKKTSYQLA